jgi:hypothetical protein
MTQDIYAAEAKDRWGQTEAYKQSQSRLANYSKGDIAKAQAAMQEATNIVLEAMTQGLAPNSEMAMAGAEAHRQAITDYWYDCNFEIHKGLATMYLADPRFTSHYESQKAGLAKYIHDAIIANANK